MDTEQFIKDVNAVDWHKFNNELYAAEQVSKALINLALANSETEELFKTDVETNAVVICPVADDVLQSIGIKDCSDKYYTAAYDALPFIMQVALHGNHSLARGCALYVIMQFFCSLPSRWNDESLISNNELLDYVITYIENNRENFINLSLTDEGNKELINAIVGFIDGEICY